MGGQICNCIASLAQNLQTKVSKILGNFIHSSPVSLDFSHSLHMDEAVAGLRAHPPSSHAFSV